MQQIEIDPIEMTSEANEHDGYAVSAFDIFSKYGWAMPIKTKQPHDVVAGFGVPEILYSDVEGSFNSIGFAKFIKGKGCERGQK